ncbi:MAG: hypothetical protein A2667_02245 [Candidatus Wildermuthbacteria bacterium RIFCSPHIGHO2_01_FULL_47_27]|uniref:Uncharacterized protein n=2 Tax=Candidatus Wildermuthiibacteriota TaxID=1817923 RepID=A0A1G2RME6_9BACT|nr:MAG: hypothetical protein UY15_C0003G0016 [Parcubacteria group bacterium GW2011_GWA2_47_9]OHA63509.1 MAG: hypothetical protein A2667_02245 [Candidatus Wildermuthbacteria bacterium RIFCSPHIGHO2_01_FULL_47_27]OHA67717.1 MAG: hypothetical protein A3D59_04770 [Candidatus Wildermuthbacteria bacterium RIFCSPHIGHO2_02_FULL_47_17]OHA73997.1 MAG: hypothetical protein A3A32_01145 [Candidatus Wildermuthbacteria bacterium RIFCSPLOWO2_01_FULL_48_35]OHA75597.1 MAG: hypothetical protein A3I38_03850 [Candid
MFLISQGKINLKYIIIVGVLAIVAGAIILSQGKAIWNEISGLTIFSEVAKPAQVADETAGWNVYENKRGKVYGEIS